MEMTAAMNVLVDRDNATAPWVKFKDPETGHDYLYNMDTGESKWDEPEEHGDDGEDLCVEWEKVYDEGSERWYMFNRATKESRWI